MVAVVVGVNRVGSKEIGVIDEERKRTDRRRRVICGDKTDGVAYRK